MADHTNWNRQLAEATAVEYEQCARVCDTWALFELHAPAPRTGAENRAAHASAMRCAAAIRARSKTSDACHPVCGVGAVVAPHSDAPRVESSETGETPAPGGGTFDSWVAPDQAWPPPIDVSRVLPAMLDARAVVRALTSRPCRDKVDERARQYAICAMAQLERICHCHKMTPRDVAKQDPQGWAKNSTAATIEAVLARLGVDPAASATGVGATSESVAPVPADMPTCANTRLVIEVRFRQTGPAPAPDKAYECQFVEQDGGIVFQTRELAPPSAAFALEPQAAPYVAPDFDAPMKIVPDTALDPAEVRSRVCMALQLGGAELRESLEQWRDELDPPGPTALDPAAIMPAVRTLLACEKLTRRFLDDGHIPAPGELAEAQKTIDAAITATLDALPTDWRAAATRNT